ncbi:septation protein IspZ, partial [Thiotrichales bacterium HSG1]|nr:septation protein IspZ [Thiotrichales bacterium HSG1]
FNYDTNTWVNFKLFGMLGLTIIFVIGQGFYLTRYIVIDDESNKDA